MYVMMKIVFLSKHQQKTVLVSLIKTSVLIFLYKKINLGDLKHHICEKTRIAPSHQVIDCWFETPKDDSCILCHYCQWDSVNYLVVYKKEVQEVQKEIFNWDSFETPIESCMKYYILFEHKDDFYF